MKPDVLPTSTHLLVAAAAAFVPLQSVVYAGELSASLRAELPPELLDYRPPVCPCVRYTPWSDLADEQKKHAVNLGYNRNSWNHHRQSYNGLEDLYWPALSPEQQSNATALGYDHHKWTCCANHYAWHHWGHMGNWWPEAQMAYEILGFNKQSWNRDFDYPASEYKHWCRNVTGEVEGVCFTELELFALEMVCFGSESVYRYDSLAKPIWGRYYKPEHCTVEDAIEDTKDETTMPTGSPTPGPVSMAPMTPVPTKSTDGKLVQEDTNCSPLGEKAVECSARPQDGRGETCCGGLICGGDRGKVCVENTEDAASSTSSATTAASMAHGSVAFAFTLSVGAVVSHMSLIT
jgi:hypothetical protein